MSVYARRVLFNMCDTMLQDHYSKPVQCRADSCLCCCRGRTTSGASAPSGPPAATPSTPTEPPTWCGALASSLVRAHRAVNCLSRSRPTAHGSNPVNPGLHQWQQWKQARQLLAAAIDTSEVSRPCELTVTVLHVNYKLYTQKYHL